MEPEMTKRSTKHSPARQRGVAVVEFTIVLPFMLFMMLAVAELGRAFLQYNTLTRAVQDGARYTSGNSFLGSTQTVSVTAALTSATGNLVAYGSTAGSSAPVLPNFSPTDVTVTDLGGGNISVLAVYAYQPMLGNLLPSFLGRGDVPTTFTMQAEVTMRAIG
jgi:Flp pilus assembly protein TadG